MYQVAGMANPKLEKRKAFELAYIETTGPYDKVPWHENIEELYAWAKSQKVMPGFYPMGIYLDDPNLTPADKRRTQVGISYKGNGRPGGSVRTRSIPAMRVAAFSHKGPGTEFAASYKKLADWIEQKGLLMSGPPIEVYSKKPEVVEGVTILYAKIMIPVETR